MLLDWFDAREAEKFGMDLAVFWDAKFRSNQKTNDRKFTDKQKKLLADILSKVGEFGRSHSMNVFKKAKLGNAFRWKLRDLGHEDSMIEQITKEILLALR